VPALHLQRPEFKLQSYQKNLVSLDNNFAIFDSWRKVSLYEHGPLNKKSNMDCPELSLKRALQRRKKGKGGTQRRREGIC
jgi:hypothetical protein